MATAQPAAPTQPVVPVAVGCYTRPEGHVPEGGGPGVRVLPFNLATGVFGDDGPTVATFVRQFASDAQPDRFINPSFVCGVAPLAAVSRDTHRPVTPSFVLAVEEIGAPAADRPAFLHLLRRDVNGEWRAAASVATPGAADCHVIATASTKASSSVDDVVVTAWVAAYCTGQVHCHRFRATPDATTVLESQAVLLPQGQPGPNPARQEAPHAHHVAALPPPDGSGAAPVVILACDLGTDTVWGVPVRPDGAIAGAPPDTACTPTPWLTLPAGSGPRHLTVVGPLPSPLGPRTFAIVVACELSSTLVLAAWREGDAALRAVSADGIIGEACDGGGSGDVPQHTTTAAVSDPVRDFGYGSPPTPTRPMPSAVVHRAIPVVADGARAGSAARVADVFVASRGPNTVSSFALNWTAGADARLTLKRTQEVSCAGGVPRDMTVVPGVGGGAWLLVANQDTDSVAVFSIAPWSQCAGVAGPLSGEPASALATRSPSGVQAVQF